MSSVTFDFAHEGQDGFKSSYSTGSGSDIAGILAKIAYAALLAAQPVHAEPVRATPWQLRVPSASSSYQETKISQDADSVLSNQLITYGNDNFTSAHNADLVHIQRVSELCDEILNFEHLSQGWDGEEAKPIPRSSIDSAINFVKLVPLQITFDAFADSDGSVGLQADTVGGRILLSFAGDGTAAYLIRNNGAVHRGHGATQDKIKKLLAIIL